MRAPSPEWCVLLTVSPNAVSGDVCMPRAPMPPPPASQMPVMSRCGAGRAGPAAAAAGPCAPPGLFQGRFCANPTVAPKVMAHAPTNKGSFMKYLLEVELSTNTKQTAAQDLDRVLPRGTVGGVHVDDVACVQQVVDVEARTAATRAAQTE